METTTRLCLACGKPLKGRTDKKFCDDYCRNAHNNKNKAEEPLVVKELWQILKKNRRILEEMLGAEEMIKQPRTKFLTKGFQFNFHTHQYTNKKGNMYTFCFEYGYLSLEGDWLLIVKRSPTI
jgi:predicted nucleic acid-binding Zn ribbon protein